MSYQVFARKYRPQNFDSVIGQEHVTRTLKNAIEQNRLAQAYLFVGPRGTGKTSTARILAKALNCINGPTVNPCGVCDSCKEIAGGNSLNVLEFDAASNTQVDKIREIIIETVKYAPTSGRYKLYIVDEVHMLSNSSFNALLKTLEEPPAHVKFIFATTDVEKVPTTIISRCQRFDLRRIPLHAIASHLLHIAEEEHVALSSAAAEAIAKGAEGGMRDAESMLDQLVAFCGERVEEDDVLAVFGFTAQQVVADLCGSILAENPPSALGLIYTQAEAGKDLSKLLGDLISHLRNLLVLKVDEHALQDELGAETLGALRAQAAEISLERLLELIDQFAESETRMKWAPNKKLHLEVAIIKAIQSLGQASLTEVIETLAAMRRGEAPTAKAERPILRAPKVAALPRPAPAKTVEQVSRPSLAAGLRAQLDARAEPAPVAPVIVPVAPVAPIAAPPTAALAVENEEPAKDREIEAVKEPAPVAEERSLFVAESAPVVAVPAVVDEAPAPAADLDVPQLWQRLFEAVHQQRPLILGWMEKGTLLSVEKGRAVIAFPETDRIASESLQRPNNRALIESLLAEFVGHAITLSCELKADLVVEKPTLPAPPPPVDPAEDFKNDPLIQKALEIFKAEIQPAESPR